MGFVKCPRCELNYVQDTEDYCGVCKREMRTKFVRDDDVDSLELCAECGERPALPGDELCAICKLENLSSDAEESEGEDLRDNSLDLGVAEMEEIALDEVDDEDMPEDLDDEMDDDDEENED